MSAIFTWDTPTMLNGGDVLLYEIMMYPSAGGVQVVNMSNVSCVLSSCVLMLGDLIPLEYSISVRAYTNVTHEDLSNGVAIFVGYCANATLNISQNSKFDTLSQTCDSSISFNC